MDINPQKPELIQEEFSIVLNGDFNPAIFQPYWLAKNDLIRENEAFDAEIEILAQDISSFKLDWISFQVLPNRFIAIVKAEAYLTHLADIVQNIFNILSNSPVKQLGINNTVSATFRSIDDWHAFGHFLVPKNQWSGVLNKPGMRSMNVQGVRNDKRPGFVVITTEPDLTARLTNKVHFRVNDHYDNPDLLNNVPMDATWIVDILRENFNGSIKNSFEIINTLTQKFTAAKTVDDGAIKEGFELHYKDAEFDEIGLFNYESLNLEVEEPLKLQLHHDVSTIKQKE